MPPTVCPALRIGVLVTVLSPAPTLAAGWLLAPPQTDRAMFGDRDGLCRQMVLSITRYRQANRRSPTWAQAVAGVDPALCEPPIKTIPDSWPLAPAVWRRETPAAADGRAETRPLGHLHSTVTKYVSAVT